MHPRAKNRVLLWDAPASIEGGRFHTAAIAYRRDVLCAVGGFDEQFRLPACEDVEIAIRVLQHGPIGFVPEAIVWHPGAELRPDSLALAPALAIRDNPGSKVWSLGIPGRSCGPFPRVRLALSALMTLPAGRLLNALKSFPVAQWDALLAASYAIFDVLCGFWVLPTIFLQPLPERQSYLPVSDLSIHERIYS